MGLIGRGAYSAPRLDLKGLLLRDGEGRRKGREGKENGDCPPTIFGLEIAVA